MPGKSTRRSRSNAAGRNPDRLLAGIDRIVQSVALWGGGAMLLGLMGLTVVDVGLRYVFDAPLMGARDVVKLMLLVMVALAVAYSARTGGQVIIIFFSRWMGVRTAQTTEAGARLLVLGMLVLLTRQLWRAGTNAARFGEASMALGIPFRPFYTILAAGMLLYALVLVIEILFIVRGRARELDRRYP